MPSKSRIFLNTNAEDSSYWKNDTSFNNLIPTPKVISILEVSGKTKFASLSFHFDYLAVVIWNEDHVTETLYIIYLKNERVEKVTLFPNQVHIMSFIPSQEDALIVGSLCDIYCFNIKKRNSKVLKGHLYLPINLSMRRGSDLLITISRFEVILWSWPKCSIPIISKLKSNGHIIEAGHIYESKLIFVAFETGLVLLWDEEDKSEERVVSPPDGILMDYRSFSLSSDGKWLIGAGSQALMVIYSMSCLRVSQVVQLSHIDSSLGIYDVKFLPYIHPQFPKCILIQTSRSIIIADFVNCSVIKVLNSNRYSIRKAVVSEDGFLLGIIYGNGVLKIYTLLSFFPEPPPVLKLSKDREKDVKFTVMEVAIKPQKKKSVQSLFNSSKWKEILNEFGEYPVRYRKHIWISLMKLPRNFSVLNDILLREKKYLFGNLKDISDDVDPRSLESLKCVLQLLCVWSASLAKFKFLPNFLFPFLKVFDFNILLGFEASIYIILNWLRFVPDFRPSDSSFVTEIVKELLSQNDSRILSHFNELKTNIEEVVWFLLSSGFREVLSEEDWLIAWDHIISKPNSYIIAFCASLIVQLRPAILKCSHKTSLLDLFHQETYVPICLHLKRVETFYKSMTIEESLKTKMDQIAVLPKGSLPVFYIESFDFKSFSNLPTEYYRNHSISPSSISSRFDKSDVELRSKEKEDSVPCIKNEGSTQTSFLRAKEDECLRNIQKVRKKLINRPII